MATRRGVWQGSSRLTSEASEPASRRCNPESRGAMRLGFVVTTKSLEPNRSLTSFSFPVHADVPRPNKQSV